MQPCRFLHAPVLCLAGLCLAGLGLGCDPSAEGGSGQGVERGVPGLPSTAPAPAGAGVPAPVTLPATGAPVPPTTGEATPPQAPSPTGAPGPQDFAVLQAGGPTPAFLETVHDAWEVLLVADWTLAAGSEGYYCARLTLTEDVYFDATVPLSPDGTHHTLLSIASTPSGADGIGPCGAGTNGDIMISGSGVGTDPMTYPEGVAVHGPKGAQLILNLHLFNPTDEEMRGRSGTLVKTVPADSVDARATTTLAGPVSLNIPPGRGTQVGRCTIARDVTLVFVSPHMHQLGVHMRGVAKHGDGRETMLWDAPYDFYEQRIYPIEPVELAAGDAVEVECTYENDTSAVVSFGDSSLSEMCFLSLFHYPEMDSGGFICPF